MNRGGFVFLFLWAAWGVDPNSLRNSFRFRNPSNESFWISLPSEFKCLRSRRTNFIRLSVVQRCRSQHSDSAVIVIVVVPVKESATESHGIFIAAETLRKFWSIFHCFEMTFRKRIVVRYVRTTVTLSDAQ